MTRMIETDKDLPPRASAQKLKWSRRWLAAFLVLIVALTHMPNLGTQRLESGHYDKVAHFTLYAVLAALALRTVTLGFSSTSAVVRCVGVLAAVAAFGLLDEATQPLTARDFDWFDWLADNIGVVVGIVSYELLRRSRPPSDL
ncbi:MAG: VanZ family protein [Pirellulales bacterium]